MSVTTEKDIEQGVEKEEKKIVAVVETVAPAYVSKLVTTVAGQVAEDVGPVHPTANPEAWHARFNPPMKFG
jgi:hypothetical protein